MDLIEEHRRPPVPLAFHHQGRDRMGMKIEMRPRIGHVGAAQFRPFPRCEGDSLHPDGAPSNRWMGHLASRRGSSDVDGPVSRHHVGLAAEMDDVAHPPAVKRNGRPAAADERQWTNLLWGNIKGPKPSFRGGLWRRHSAAGHCSIPVEAAAPYRQKPMVQAGTHKSVADRMGSCRRFGRPGGRATANFAPDYVVGDGRLNVPGLMAPDSRSPCLRPARRQRRHPGRHPPRLRGLLERIRQA